MEMKNKFGFISQYKSGLYQYAMRIRFQSGRDTAVKRVMKGNIGKFRPIFVKSDSNEDKLKQYSTLFRKVKIDTELKNGFLYFLDVKCVPCNVYAVIDNMPVDYSLIVDHSLQELRDINLKTANKTAERNLRLIEIAENFIDRIGKKANESNRIQISWIRRMKEYKAESLEEALQRILFWNQLLWQTDHLLNGLGRLDKILDRFCGDVGQEESISRFLKTLHCYYELKSNEILGDTGQIIILGGTEPDGSYFCNQITYSIINCLAGLKCPDPKALLRVSANMPQSLLDMAVRCISTGCGSPLLSNDDSVLPALKKFGYVHEDACNYGVSACWEPLSIGNSLEQNNLCDIEFGKVFVETYTDSRFCDAGNAEDVFAIYAEHLNRHLKQLCRLLDAVKWEKDPICTFFNKNCLRSDKDMAEGGALYNNYGLLSVGLSSAVDSLINIERYVFEENKITMDELAECLSNNYAGYEEIKELFSQKEEGFGSNSEKAVKLTSKIMDIVSDCLSPYRNPFGGKVKFGLSSPAYVLKGKQTGATADGRAESTPFTTHISREKDSAMLDLAEFACKLDYSGVRANGNVVDVIVHPALLSEDRAKFSQYLRVCIQLGVFQIQFNVLSYRRLLEAKAHPEKYPDLMVRVWGFSAYFKDIPEEYQDALIRRAKERECA